MSKSLLFRWFGLGKIPGDARAQIDREGVVFEEEGISGSVTFRRFRAPGRRYGWRRTWFMGSIVLTREHFLAFTFSRPIVGVAWHHPRLNDLHCSLAGSDTLCVQFDVAAFHEGWSGDIEVRFSTPMAPKLLREIEKHQS